MNKIVQGVGNAIVRPAPPPALSHFLKHCLDAYGGENQGAVADYIPELSKASPAHFGIGLATIDGQVYQAGDAGVEFTIQSISKAFVFALALELLGQDRVEAKIGVQLDPPQRRQQAVQRDGQRRRHRLLGLDL